MASIAELNDTRQIWREAVNEIAQKAKATLPQCNGRVEKAVQIVLNGDVELLSDGKAKVASQSSPVKVTLPHSFCYTTGLLYHVR